MNTADDPFADTPDAVRAGLEIRRPFVRVEKTCELVGKPKRKKTDFGPMQRRWFEQNGYTYARVEHANAYGSVTVDLWGFGDYLACRPGEILLVQVTDHTDAAKRVTKARSKPELA